MTHSVVNCTIENSIATIQMADREAKNTFSTQLIQELMTLFDSLNQNPAVKVVVIHGYEQYFCCGGTQTELLRIFKGEIMFNDLAFYRLLLDCPYPTIAAMQGHAVGGGLAFGCYADIILLAEECVYTTNFMKYGFTPGMGATYIVPKKFGEIVGSEMLYTADTYLGSTLKNKGITVPVLKKNEVISHAVNIAKQLADKPQHSLKILKAHLTEEIREKLPAIIKKELDMHHETFANPEVKNRIDQLYGK